MLKNSRFAAAWNNRRASLTSTSWYAKAHAASVLAALKAESDQYIVEHAEHRDDAGRGAGRAQRRGGAADRDVGCASPNNRPRRPDASAGGCANACSAVAPPGWGTTTTGTSRFRRRQRCRPHIDSLNADLDAHLARATGSQIAALRSGGQVATVPRQIKTLDGPPAGRRGLS